MGGAAPHEPEARDGVRLVCGTHNVHLPHDNARAALAAALDGSPVLIVSGDSGTGKSALVRSLVSTTRRQSPKSSKRSS